MKGLEALCYLDDIAHGRKMKFDAHELKLIVEKELKALEIIKNKKVDVWTLGISTKLSMYHYCVDAKIYKSLKLTKEEFKLLKEALFNE